jgi:hypothetical protein
MAKSNRKPADRKARGKSSQTTRRSVFRRGRDAGDQTTQSKAKSSSAEPPKGSNGGAKATADGEEKVSSMLKMTGDEVKRLLAAADDAAEKIRQAAEVDSPVQTDAESSDEIYSLVGKINTEAQRILELANDAAEKIREEARGEAKQLIEDTKLRAEHVTAQRMDRVSEMTDQVLTELAAVKAKLDDLQSAYGQAMKSLNADLDDAAGELATSRNGGRGAEPESAALRRRLGQKDRVKSAKAEAVSEGARLIALQQLMAGEDREVVASRLKDEFGIANPEDILEDISPQADEPTDPKKR